MKFDDSKFPIVWAINDPEKATTSDQTFDDLESLLNRKTKFAIISDGSGQDMEKHEHSKEEMKQMSLWMKWHKEDIKRYVLGMVFVEVNSVKRIAGKAMLTVSEKFWGYPIFLAASQEEALQIVEKLLLDA